MLYDIHLAITYDYEMPVAGGRHILRLLPLTLPGTQRLVAGSLSIEPRPAERSDGADFFGNTMTSIAFRDAHAELALKMQARVAVEPEEELLDICSPLGELPGELAGLRSLGPESPLHFIAPSPRIPAEASIAVWARGLADARVPVRDIARAMTRRIHEEFRYDPEATRVETTPKEAFDLKRGVCQDFAQVMITGLRALGIPAAYVSGYLRTTPPPGKERLAGADAMHAWVRVWCGVETGWLGFDPTNDLEVAEDHISVAHGRDYSDVAPVVGVFRSYGSQRTAQAVDVIPVG